MSPRPIPASSLLACLVLLFCPAHAAAQTQSLPLTSGPVLPLYRALKSVGLDPQQVYSIREAVIDREDVHVWLNDGTLAFTTAIDGRITGAYFEGDGEVLVRPPDRMERASLGLFTGTGVLEEKFASAYLRFNDDTAKDLQPYLRPAQNAADFVARSDGKARVLAEMDATRLCISFTSAAPAAGEAPPVPDRLLHIRVAGEHYGVFDVYFDTRSPEQIAVGKASAPQENETYYDLWMSFPMRSLRKTPLSDSRFGGPSGPLWTPDVMDISKYTINAKLDPPHELAADATLEAVVKQGGARMVLFELSRYLQLKEVDFEDKPLEFIQNEAVEGSEMSRRGNDTFAVVFPAPLQPGARLALRFSYTGSVLSDAGGGLLYVGARGIWYPNRGISMASYDLTFRFPRPWSLVATGKQMSLERDGNGFVGRWVSEQPIPVAGFNLGEYIRSSARTGEIAVEAFAARGTERRLPPPTKEDKSSQMLSPRPLGTLDPVPFPPPLPNAASAGQLVADRAAQTLAAYSQMLGPYAFSTLSLTENPSAASQGWPGLIFLSSYAYLSRDQLETMNLTPMDRVLYGEVMMPHELAHQWYGDKVSWASYHEQWLLEALANECALMLLERTRPADAQLVLDSYREILSRKTKDGRRQVVAGPVTLGARLSSSMFPSGYEIITYGRGTWIIQMLRGMLRDASRTAEDPDGDDKIFLGLLRTLVDRYQQKEITNEDFEKAIEEVLPRSLWFEGHRSLNWFFDGWVNGTAFPQLEVADTKFERNGKSAGTVSFVVRQKLAPPDLVTNVPVYGVAGYRKIYLGRVFAEGEEMHFTLGVPSEVKQLVLDPYGTVLTSP
ncbi:MAG: M1 family aminopeptidase [Acidobacteriota bacterium]|nr:M1 family aminopeptidase [Acidobacteriota bacterium]